MVTGMMFVNFGILYLRLVPAFIQGVKKGCKFSKIVKFAKDDREVNAPGVILPGVNNPGMIQYEEHKEKRPDIKLYVYLDFSQ